MSLLQETISQPLGNPLALAAAKAVLKEINTECMRNHIYKMGEKIQNTIRSWNLDIISRSAGKGAYDWNRY